MLENVMQKTWKMTPTWRQNGGRHRSKNMRKLYKKKITENDAKTKRQRGRWARSARRGIRSSSGDSRSRFPLASNILQKTNTRQTTKKQSPRTSSCQLTRTWRAGRHGAGLYIYWAHGPLESSRTRPDPSSIFPSTFSCRLYVIGFRVLSGFRVPFVVVLGSFLLFLVSHVWILFWVVFFGTVSLIWGPSILKMLGFPSVQPTVAESHPFSINWNIYDSRLSFGIVLTSFFMFFQWLISEWFWGLYFSSF